MEISNDVLLVIEQELNKDIISLNESLVPDVDTYFSVINEESGWDFKSYLENLPIVHDFRDEVEKSAFYNAVHKLKSIFISLTPEEKQKFKEALFSPARNIGGFGGTPEYVA